MKEFSQLNICRFGGRSSGCFVLCAPRRVSHRIPTPPEDAAALLMSQ